MSSEKEKSSPTQGVQDANSDAESLRGPTIDPLTGEHQLVRQLKNRHIAMIRLVCWRIRSIVYIKSDDRLGSKFSIGGVIGTG